MDDIIFVAVYFILVGLVLINFLGVNLGAALLLLGLIIFFGEFGGVWVDRIFDKLCYSFFCFCKWIILLLDPLISFCVGMVIIAPFVCLLSLIVGVFSILFNCINIVKIVLDDIITVNLYSENLATFEFFKEFRFRHCFKIYFDDFL